MDVQVDEAAPAGEDHKTLSFYSTGFDAGEPLRHFMERSNVI